MILPEVLHSPFKTILDSCKLCIPHNSTISRWKLLLDGCVMLLQRRLNERLHFETASSGAGGVCRFLMAYAFTQPTLGKQISHVCIVAYILSSACAWLDSCR